ncbi:MAG: hypothetical protein AAF513_07240 [Pseudomonadota bacterium]
MPDGRHAPLLPALADAPLHGDAPLLDFLRATSGVANVTLAAEVFRQTHILVLEPRAQAGAAYRIATGRMAAPAHVYHLLGDGQRCVVHHLASDTTLELEQIACTRVASPPQA